MGQGIVLVEGGGVEFFLFMLSHQEKALLVLNGLPHIGPITLSRLMKQFSGDAVALMNASENELKEVEGVGKKIAMTIKDWREHFDLNKELKGITEIGVEFISFENPEYPVLLSKIADPPIGLYKKGPMSLESVRCISIVGTRRPTLYGQRIAKKVAGRLARAGFCIVSGLARGVDAAAHEGALEVGGKTVGVLGCGIDIVYPPENKELYDRMIQDGAILSEFPIGRPADRQTFPMRNRVVAGICEAVIVIESARKGGSLITARMAGEQGRGVFAFPGRVDQETSAGCHELIRDGAVLVTCAEDILDDLGSEGQGLLDLQLDVHEKRKEETAEAPKPNLSNEEQAIFDILKQGEALSQESIMQQCGQPAHVTAPTLMSLELKRLISKRLDGKFEVR